MSPFASPAVRVLSVLAAFALVLAFALAITLPPSATLAQVLARWSPTAMAGLEAFMLRRLPDWAWNRAVVPMLDRPCWLLPVDVALVCGGIAVTIVLRRGRAAERRRG
ncbi:MAG: hypothetical protein IT555_17720 [Acetobacteraceae bacterium]|nr:hypothetical protein [Acetobacteraceae bacterium]